MIMSIAHIETPALILDRGILDRNLSHISNRASELGVTLRPHLKTVKSAVVAERALGGQHGGITVSTLKEAEYFLNKGFRDITYAVGIEASKLPHVQALQEKGANITLILDHPITAQIVIEEAAALGASFSVLIEIDSGSHRGGFLPDNPEFLKTASCLHQAPHISFKGVLTHAGCAYLAGSVEEIADIAEDERAAVVRAATRLEEAGIPCPVRSVGSTPTAMFARDLTGVTEIRPGVYMLMDLYQAGLGVCQPQDIAVSVLATVIGRRDDLGYALIDAGALALSQDVSAARTFDSDTIYGQIRDRQGKRVYDGLRLDTVHQEHGWLRASQGGSLPAALVPGTRVRIYPNHACMMAAPYDCYHVVDGGDEIIEAWEKTTGW